VLEEFATLMADRRVVLQNDFPETLPVAGDPALLRIVYKNLVGNALKYGREGGCFRLGCAREDASLRLEVWNEGRGLSREQLSRLFGKFVRFHDERDTDRKGTGLGLFITKEIVEKHGGRIWAESQEGQWIRFLFTLPVDSAAVP
jgi:signal transduction histidine kinase